MKARLTRLRTRVNLPRAVPHLLVYRASPRRATIDADLRVWAEQYELDGSWIENFVQLMVERREFRNLFYYRVRPFHHLLKPLFRPLPTLFLNAKEIGPGLFIQHGDGSRINGERIGSNCWVNQLVTIGYSNKTDRPILEDGVRVGPGARVFGKIRIGAGSIIGANAVVVKDVPPRCTVVGVYPCYIVRQDGQRVLRKL